jgi:flavin-dependent dehydrogenase
LLHEWGLLQQVAAICPAVCANTTDFGDGPITATNLENRGIAWGYGPRRILLDKILIDAATDAGAELRDGFAVEEFLGEGELVTGIRGTHRSQRRPLMERARITIGADGRNSSLATAVHAPVYKTQPALSCWYFSYWSGVDAGFELYSYGAQAIFSFPTSENLFAVMIAWPIARFREIKSDIDRHFMAAVDRVPGFAERVRSGHREERYYGAADLPNYYRKPWGSGWALVGDAGYHKDPYMATGIADAFRDAELLADAVDRGLKGEVTLEAALAEYERRRNEASAEEYEQNLRWARLEGAPPEVLELRNAIRGDQEMINRFEKARIGIAPREEFFNPENMARLLGRIRLG